MFCFQASKSRFTVRSNHDVTERGRVADARGGELLLGEERYLAEALRLPDRQREERGAERGGEEHRVRATAGRAGRRAPGPPRKSDVRRLERERDAGERPGEDRLAVRARLERAHGERGGDEDRDDRREVRLLREPERLRQELVDPRVVVALHEVRDREERRGDERAAHQSPASRPARRAPMS